jgi:tripartite-type tricarboxylate transporter receptor subunit TctC
MTATTWIRRVLALAAAGLAAAFCAPANAQSSYPVKAITAIVPYAAGGNTDVIGRIVLEFVSKSLGQPIIVENIGGAGGTTGSLRGAKAAPDGYTILVGQMGTHGASPALYANLGYDPVEDFAHVSQLTDTPIAIFAKKALPVATLQDLIELIRKDPGKLNNGHGGVGATSHVSCLLFTSLIGARSPMIPYRGSGPALQDLVAGNHDFMCDQIPHTVGQVQAGAIKALAIGTQERAPVIPNTPTTAEAGLPAFQASGWNALFAPKGTPRPIVDRLADAVSKALDDPATRGRLEQLGAIIPPASRRGPDALRAFVDSEVRKWTPVIKAANVVAN